MFVFISWRRFKLLDKLLHIRGVGCLEGRRRFSIDCFTRSMYTSMEEEVGEKKKMEYDPRDRAKIEKI